jgi:hypothetical protein
VFRRGPRLFFRLHAFSHLGAIGFVNLPVGV